MLPLAADENVDGRVLRGLRLRLPNLDLLRVQGSGLTGAPDPGVLAWAAGQDRVLLSHDVNTMIGFAAERLRNGEAMPGLVILPQTESVGLTIDALEELVTTTEIESVRNQIIFLQP